MKLCVALSSVVGLLAPGVVSFVPCGSVNVAHHALSGGIVAHPSTFARPVCSRQRANRVSRTSDLAMVSKVIPSDFKLPIGIAALGLAITGTGNVGAGFPVSLVGLALAFQATRVSFEFDDVAMEVKIGNDEGQLESSGENAFVGGESRWSYDSWTNWEVYPSESFPILMYFKETQTKPEGQIHFFPFIMSPEALLEQVRARVPQVAK